MDIEPTATDLTYVDLDRLFPEVDLVRRELIDGELFVSPSPIPRHQRVVVELASLLLAHSKDHGGQVYPGPLDVYFTERDVVEPDVLFVTAEHADRIEDRFIRGAPDLVIEVSSPSTRRHDLVRKRGLYEAHGVPEYWFVDLDHDRVEAYRPSGRRYGKPTVVGRGEILASTTVPGFEVAVDEVLGPGS